MDLADVSPEIRRCIGGSLGGVLFFWKRGLWTFRRKARDGVLDERSRRGSGGKASCIRIFARELLVRIKKRNSISVFLKVFIKSIK